MNKYRTKAQIINNIKMKKFMESLKDAPEYDYIGKPVMLNTDGYDKRIKNGELSQNFIKWYEDNKNKEHLVKGKNERIEAYELDDDEVWLFNQHDLLTKCDNCGEYINMNLYYCEYCGKSYLENKED